ncbi:MAG: serpin family protein [Desulfobacterales bacterium]
MRKSMMFFAVLGIFLCQVPARASENREVQPVVKANTEFALDLYGTLRRGEGNLFFSPYSISSALAMTWAGAGGQTAEQMASVLHFASEPGYIHAAFSNLQKELDVGEKKRAYELHIANALWVQQGCPLQKEFTDLLDEQYAAGLRQCNFAGAAEESRQMINAWVEDKTRDKITDLITPGILDALTRLVLTNAVYFKGMWASQFKKEQTQPAPFTLADGNISQVSLMHQKGNFGYFETKDLQVLEMPYEGDDNRHNEIL